MHSVTEPRPTPESQPPPAPVVPTPPKRSWGKPIFWGLVLAAAAGWTAYRGVPNTRNDLEHLYKLAREQVVGKPAPFIEKVVPSKDFAPWDGLVTVVEKERKPLGMNFQVVEPQTQPLLMELNGTTDYDLNNLAKIRPLFDARVQKVFKSTGEEVRKGEPLVELFSNELLAAKNEFRTKYVQWDHTVKLLESRRPLVATNAITAVAWAETQIAEKRSRVEYIQAHEKLVVLGLAKEEVEKLLTNLSDSSQLSLDEKEAQDLARMTVKSPIDGVVVERSVVSGNYYDANEVLMVISPMDHLWVWANVFEKDQAKVALGMMMNVQFPFLSDQAVRGRVEAIDNRVDPVTRSVRIRVSIPNPSIKYKADMLVRAFLEIPPGPGLTRIPRNALNIINGDFCVFVQSRSNPDKFERRLVEVEQETSTYVVVSKGIQAGERVVTNGSLVMAQLYEDLVSVTSGMPAK